MVGVICLIKIMKISNKLIVVFIFGFFLSACDLFELREPEEPDTGRANFEPPTSPAIVIANLQNAIKERNVENYIACLSDTSQQDLNYFKFIPSSDAMSLYSSVFQYWNLYSERAYLNKLFSSLPIDIVPDIKLINSKFDIMLPDSAVFIADYSIYINQNKSVDEQLFQGTMQLILTPRNNGLWSIKMWFDFQLKSDTTTSNTWSILKALYGN